MEGVTDQNRCPAISTIVSFWFDFVLKVASHCEEIVNQGGLQLLMRLCTSKAAAGSLKIQCYIARILANMAVNERLHSKIVQAGR